jgi:hypothetical protein
MEDHQLMLSFVWDGLKQSRPAPATTMAVHTLGLHGNDAQLPSRVIVVLKDPCPLVLF